MKPELNEARCGAEVAWAVTPSPGQSLAPRAARPSRAAAFERGLAVLRAYVAREGHARVPPRHVEGHYRLGQWVWWLRGRHRAKSLPLSWAAVLQSLPGWTWEPTRELPARSRGLASLQVFVAREGHADVPRGHVESGFRLGRWVAHQRRLHAARRVSIPLRRVLEAMAGWDWTHRDHLFEARLRLLETFAAREGHARVPQKHVEGGIALGQWVSYVRGKRRLSPPQRATLERFPGWTWVATHRDQMFGLEILKAFLGREGHARVPVRHRERDYPLGEWVRWQREAYREGRLPEELARELEGLPGWTWNADGDRFQEGLRALRSFVGRHGHALVPSGHVESGFRLGNWVCYARAARKTGVLPAWKVEALDAVEGWKWSVKG